MTDMLTVDQSKRVPAPAVDFGVAAGDYATHRIGHPPETFARLAALGIGTAGQELVDLGTGTGAAARGFAAAGARVTGVDPSAALLAEAARLAGEAGVAVSWRHGVAEDTGLPTGGFDAVTAAQAWHWFDRPRAAAEARRLLRPGGALAIFYFDWLPLPGSVVEATLALVARHRTEPMPAATRIGHHGVYPELPADLTGAGFERVELFGFDRPQRYSHAGWLGRMRASAGVATMAPPAQAAFAADLSATLSSYPDPLPVPHRVFALIGRAPG